MDHIFICGTSSEYKHGCACRLAVAKQVQAHTILISRFHMGQLLNRDFHRGREFIPDCKHQRLRSWTQAPTKREEERHKTTRPLLRLARQRFSSSFRDGRLKPFQRRRCGSRYVGSHRAPLNGRWTRRGPPTRLRRRLQGRHWRRRRLEPCGATVGSRGQ